MARRVVLVTGSSSGIGAAAARRLAGPGVAVGVHCRGNRAGAEAVAAEVRARGGEAAVLVADLAEAEAPARLVAEAAAALGGLDAVVANAGFADRTPVSALEDAAFDRSLDLVLRGFLRLARAAGPHLLASGEAGRGARLVAVSSFVAHQFRTDQTLFPASAAAKAGVEALVRSLALAWAPRVTVNAVVPGYTRKDAGAHAALDPAAWAAVLPRIPMGRLGEPAEVAGAIAYLLSEEAGYVTGQALHVSGGIVA